VIAAKEAGVKRFVFASDFSLKLANLFSVILAYP
jgi:hypothetical protein